MKTDMQGYCLNLPEMDQMAISFKTFMSALSSQKCDLCKFTQTFFPPSNQFNIIVSAE